MDALRRCGCGAVIPVSHSRGRPRLSCVVCRPPRSDYSRFEHGTRRGYRDAHCRCGACTDWNRRQGREYATARRAAGDPIKRFGSSGPWISPAVKVAVFERDDWLCRICGVALDRGAAPNDNLFPSIDHVVPQSGGGGHEFGNLRAAHRWCNSVRQDREVA